MPLTPRERVLNLFARQPIDRIPCFSGMGNVITEGMRVHGIRFAEAHADARQMATLAASMYQLCGYECAVVPFDLGVEAEVLGCTLNRYEGVESDDILYPTIREKVVTRAEEIRIPAGLEGQGRVPVVCRALRLLRQEVGAEVAVGSYLLGPFTLAGQVMELNDLLKMSFKQPAAVNAMLERLSDLIIALAGIYQDAGADYLTFRVMGACADVLNPRVFRNLIQPHLTRILGAISGPKVLHICGSTNAIVPAMAECGADAISVDQKNDLVQTRLELGPDVLLFGNFDPYKIQGQGTPQQAEEAAQACIASGVNAVWPGCDIWPTAPAENVRALVQATQVAHRS
ncbi:MAG: MtaA/CmuA family methyltransferase [Candidatus Tectomicrobia bacterium]|uniref:MtaA/CmuA family methyltransferase n=1 Tax=Tectimicrobiota bacterium TaxID=2528274 RepID=A0A932FW70_UNCTE|nr:MtaA/CmuA family methyltransferase [Candidatus Tectomicrobia bacterium]